MRFQRSLYLLLLLLLLIKLNLGVESLCLYDISGHDLFVDEGELLLSSVYSYQVSNYLSVFDFHSVTD